MFVYLYTFKYVIFFLHILVSTTVSNTISISYDARVVYQ